MHELYKLNNKTIYDKNTTILYTSTFNYIEDAIFFINNHCVVITKERDDYLPIVKNEYYELFDELELKNKQDLTEIDKLKIKILSSLSSENKIYVFFNVLTYLPNKFKTKLVNYIKSQNKIIINYTTDIEETLLLEYLIVFHNEKIIMEGKKEYVLQEEKILKKLGFNLPSIVELSIGLKYYGLVNKIYFNSKELVDSLWK